MKQRYQYRIYPTQPQIHDLARLFGCCRVVYNDALALSRIAEKLPKNSDLQKTCITLAKKTEKREWLSEVSNIPLQQSIIDLGTAYTNYFASLKGVRTGQKIRRPNFKKRKGRQTARFRKGGFSIKNGKVFLAKVGLIEWEPTSQRCSCCGEIGGKKELAVREWECLFCGAIHDRDVNAAVNIKVAGGVSETLNGRGGSRQTTIKVAASCEASTIPLVKQLSLFH